MRIQDAGWVEPDAVKRFVLACCTLLLISCQGDRPPTAPEPMVPDEVSTTPAAAISDGAHGGDPHFFFLPPLVADPNPTGTFEPRFHAYLRVEICELESSDCVGDPVAIFTADGQPASQTIRLNEADGHYIFNWKTSDFDLDLGSPYRIRVMVQNVEFGHLDVHLTSSGKDAKNIDTGAMIPLVDGRILPVRFRVEEGVGGASIVGPAGGQVTSEDETTTILLPKGAVSGEGLLTVVPVNPPAALPLESFAVLFGDAVDITLTDALLIGNATVQFGFDISEIDITNLALEDLGVVRWSGSSWDEVPSTVDGTAAVVSAITDRLSTWSLRAAAFPYSLEGDGYVIRWRETVEICSLPVAITLCTQDVHLQDGVHDPLPDDQYDATSAADPSNDIPDYIEDVEAAVQYALNAYTTLGYRLPDVVQVFVSDMTQDAPKLWQHFQDLYGLWPSCSDCVTPLAPNVAWIDNNQCEIRLDAKGDNECTGPINVQGGYFSTSTLLPLIVAHELFHVVQNQYGDHTDDFGRDSWLRESTARFMENILFDEHVDFQENEFGWYDLLREYPPEPVILARSLFARPPSCFIQEPFRFGDQCGDLEDNLARDRYRHFPFFQFLSGRYGTSIVRDVWEQFEYAGSGLIALRDAVDARPETSLGQEFAAFAEDYLYEHAEGTGEYAEWNQFHKGDEFAADFGSPLAWLEFSPFTPTTSHVVDMSSSATAQVDIRLEAMSARAIHYEMGSGRSAGTLRLQYEWAGVPAGCLGSTAFASNTLGEPGTPLEVPPETQVAVADLGQGQKHVVFVVTNCDLAQDVSIALTAQLETGEEWEHISAGRAHTCALASGGKAYCWGFGGGVDLGGLLGNGTHTTSLTPVPVSGGLTFGSISSSSHTCAVTVEGRGYCWGANSRGQLGNGQPGLSVSEPLMVSGNLTFSSISPGLASPISVTGSHTCGVATDGRAYCWGAGSSGQLGTGSTADSSVPVLVAGGLTFTQIDGGELHTCGLTTSAEAYCWGTSSWGALGSITSSSTPLPVSAGLTFTSIATGLHHSCGIATDGKAYCWGLGFWGQLGNGSTTQKQFVPAPVSGGHTFVSIGAGERHSCGITTDGKAYCWGDNEVGQLGHGSATGSLVPVPVFGDLSFSSLGVGTFHNCAVSSIGQAYCWGHNTAGKLGDGSTNNAFVPVAVSSP